MIFELLNENEWNLISKICLQPIQDFENCVLLSNFLKNMQKINTVNSLQNNKALLCLNKQLIINCLFTLIPAEHLQL